MPPHSDPDQIRILIATDNHVGFDENDPIRGDDSWRTFDEILRLAKDRDVDMVLLGGDLFHHHTPTRKSMLHVIQSLRLNCLGNKPCELEFLSDGTELFGSIFNHVNYEDPNINVAIPVFSIHGNHDEPTGHEFFAALDVLQETGLINYFGRANKGDDIRVKPVLFQKGRTKLAMYGLSNLRDERLFRAFRGNLVHFSLPDEKPDEFFNLMVVHQNHHSRTPTGYLPESFLPVFLDLVIWGHEHDCLIEPRYVDEQGFHVIQPGSSVATQLTKGETIPKHVAILTVKGKNFQVEPIRLKTVRPFIFKEIVLADEKELKNLWKKSDNRAEISRHLKKVIKDMVGQATREWRSLQSEADLAARGDTDLPRPLVRLRVDYTAPEGGVFDIENAQRITSDFMETVANCSDVIVFHMKKRNATKKVNDIDIPEQWEEGNEDEIHEEGGAVDALQMGKLVREFLEAQSLTILPQNLFGNAVTEFIDGNDRDSMAQFVNESLGHQINHLIGQEDIENIEILQEAMENYRIDKEKLFEAGGSSRANRANGGVASRVFKPRPDGYESDLQGPWEENPEALMGNGHFDSDIEMISDTPPVVAGAKRGTAALQGRGRGRGAKAGAAPSRPAARSRTMRGRGKAIVVEDDDEEEEEENESDVNMQLRSDPESDSQSLFVSSRRQAPAAAAPKITGRRLPTSTTKKPAASKAANSAKGSAAGSSLRQARLDFASQAAPATKAAPRGGRSTAEKAPVIELSDDEIEDDDDDDDDDAFEALPVKKTTGRRR